MPPQFLGNPYESRDEWEDRDLDLNRDDEEWITLPNDVLVAETSFPAILTITESDGDLFSDDDWMDDPEDEDYNPDMEDYETTQEIEDLSHEINDNDDSDNPIYFTFSGDDDEDEDDEIYFTYGDDKVSCSVLVNNDSNATVDENYNLSTDTDTD